MKKIRETAGGDKEKYEKSVMLWGDNLPTVFLSNFAKVSNAVKRFSPPSKKLPPPLEDADAGEKRKR